MIPALFGWESLLGRLAVEAAVLVAVATWAGHWTKVVQWRRLIWQSVFLGVAVVWGVEVLGGRDWLPKVMHHHPEPMRSRVVTTSMTDADPDRDATEAIGATRAPRSEPPSSARTPKWPGVVWLAGMAAFLSRALGARVWLAWQVHGGRVARDGRVNPVSVEAVERIRNGIGLGPVELLILPGLRGPVAFGICRPTIAVPGDFEERFPALQREAMLAHELGHLIQRDPLWLLLADLVSAVAWWHPLVWWARRQFRAACEAAADDVSTCVPGGRVALAEALVGFGRELTAPGGLGVGGSGLRSELAKRVKELLGQAGERRPLRPFRLWSLRISLTALVCALLLIPWPGEDGGLGTILAAVRAEEATPTRPTEPPVATSDGGTTSAAKTPFNPSLPPAVANPAPTATTAAEARSLPQVLLSVSLVSINDHSDDEIGLDWLFGQQVTNTSPAISVPASRIRGLETPLRGEGVRVDLMTVEGQSAVLSQSQFAALKARLERRQGVDFLAAPKVTTLSGRQAQVSISDILSLVTGVELREASATNQSGVVYLTEKVPKGVLVDLVPELEGNAWRLKILASITEFRGYDQPGSTDRIRVDHGKPGFEKAVVPLPRLRIREVNASNTVRNGNVLALRGPLTEEIIQFKDKVPVLGDIPLLGRLFRKESSQTRRSRLYVFVQPEEVDGSGQKVVRP